MNRWVRIFRYQIPLHLVVLFTNWLPDNVIFLKLRGLLASPFFKKCGKNLMLGRNITLNDSQHIEIGNNVYIAYGCWFSVSDGLVIEDEVMIGPYCIFATSNHSRLNNSFRYGSSMGKKIILSKGSWLGAHTCVLSGSTIGEGSAIASNSTIISDCQSHSLYAGNPAVFKRKLDE